MMQEISNSLNTEAVRLLAAIFKNSRHKPRARRWNFEEKFWLCPYISVAQNPIFFYRLYSLFHQDAPCNPSSIPLILGPASIPMFFMHFVALCRICQKKTGTIFSCFMKCRSERKSSFLWRPNFHNRSSLSEYFIFRNLSFSNGPVNLVM